MTAIRISTALVASCALLIACDSVDRRLAAGEALVGEAKFDEAIAAYEKIPAEFPDDPGISEVPAAIEAALVAKANATYEAGDWDGVATTMVALIERTSPDEAIASVGQLDNSLGIANAYMFADRRSRSVDADTLNEVYPIWMRAGPALKADVGTWICEKRKEFPAYKACSSLSGKEVTGAVRSNYVAYDQAKAGCDSIGRLKEVCGDEIRKEIVGMEATLIRFQVLIAGEESGWRAQITEEWKPHLGTLTKLARNCENMKVKVRQIIQQGMRTDRETAEFYWRGVGTGAIKPDAEIPKTVREFQTDFASKVLLYAKVMKSDDWSDACNEAVDEAANRIYQDCAQNGAPVDLAWIQAFMPATCPHETL